MFIPLRSILAASAAVAALTAGAQAQVECPIKIGGLAPLSAPGTVVGGEAMRDAMLIAQDDINAAGGVLGCDIEVVIGDTEGLPERGVAVVERLITQDGVVAMGGAYHSSVGVATKGVLDARGIPTVYAETWNDTITGDKHQFIFRIAPLSSWASANIWRFALSVPDVNKVVILTENTDYGIPASQETQQGLASGDVESTIFGVDIGTQDFSGIIERIRAENPDMIITLATGEAAYNFTQQAADAGIGPMDLPFITGQDALESGAYWRNVPDGQYAFVQRIGLPESAFSDKGKAFAATYKEKTGKADVESYAMEAYDSIAILAQAIEEAGTTDGAAVVAKLETIQHEGTLGLIYFPYGSLKDPSEDGHGDEWWHQWPDVALTMIQFQNQGEASSEAAIVWPDVYKTAEPVWVHQ